MLPHVALTRYGHSLEDADALLAQRWMLLVLDALGKGTRRFRELERDCPGISTNVLSKRLRQLESAGVVRREEYAESPPRVEYTLTGRGLQLLPVLDELRRFTLVGNRAD